MNNLLSDPFGVPGYILHYQMQHTSSTFRSSPGPRGKCRTLLAHMWGEQGGKMWREMAGWIGLDVQVHSAIKVLVAQPPPFNMFSLLWIYLGSFTSLLVGSIAENTVYHLITSINSQSLSWKRWIMSTGQKTSCSDHRGKTLKPSAGACLKP